MQFDLISKFAPMVINLKPFDSWYRAFAGQKNQTLLGVTGSGKTFTAANVIKELGMPTLVLDTIRHWQRSYMGNSKPFFPNNAVEYRILL